MSAPTITIRWDDANALRDVHGLINGLPKAVRASVAAAVQFFIAYTIRTAFENKGPKYLNRRTGSAIRSVTASGQLIPITETDTVIAGGFGSNLDYVRAHEFGFRGNENVKQYTRRINAKKTSVNRLSQARQAVRMQSTLERAKVQARELGTCVVRAHTRRVNMRERRMFRDALEARWYVFNAICRNAIQYLLDHKKAPTGSELFRSVSQYLPGASSGYSGEETGE